jgi:hypothetical protein
MPFSKQKCSTCIDCGIKTTKLKAIRCGNCNKIFKKINSPERSEYVRNWHIKKKYGFENDEFDAWWIVFKGKCGICNNDLKMPLPQRGQPLNVVAIDHDHKTGKIRGLLCNACNKGLGLFHDSPDLLISAIRYLENGKKTGNDPQN